MVRTLCFFSGLSRKVSLATVLFLSTLQSMAQGCDFTNFIPVTTAVPNSMFTGYIVHLPNGYNGSDNSVSYPLILTFPGNLAAGDGSATTNGLCKLFSDQPMDLPNRVRTGDFPLSGLTVNGVTYNFIVVAAQYSGYDYDNNSYPKADDVEALLNQVLQNYRVDPLRVYLTGISAGANLAIQYPASSTIRAQRVAAVSVLSGCSPVNLAPNQPGDPGHIASANLPVWFLHCPQDGTGPGTPCDIATPQGWVSAINNNMPATPARLTALRPFDNSNPVPLDMCQGFAHNTWQSGYNQAFKPAELGNRNVFEWLLTNSRSASALPVTLTSFTARLQSGRVYLRWTAATENRNAYFTLERAGADQQFTTIGTVKGSGTSTSEKVYEYIDNSPLSNLSYYRLVQTDESNKKTYFEVRKMMNRIGASKLLSANPNPFKSELSAFIHVNRPQQVSIWITDMNGKRLMARQSLFAEGTTTVNLDIAALPSGIYLLKASSEGTTEISKIIKQQ